MNARTIKILGSVIIAIIAVVGIILAVVPLITSIQSSPEIAAAKQRNQQLQSQVQQLQSAKDQEAAITRVANDLKKRFPQAADVPGLISTVSNAAVSSGIPSTNITSFGFTAPSLGAAPQAGGAGSTTAPSQAAATPAPGATSGTAAGGTGTGAGTSTAGQYATLGVNLTVLGNNGQFATFMNKLTNMDRSFSITNFSITGSDSGSSLTLAGTTYLYKAVPSPSSSAR